MPPLDLGKKKVTYWWTLSETAKQQTENFPTSRRVTFSGYQNIPVDFDEQKLMAVKLIAIGGGLQQHKRTQ